MNKEPKGWYYRGYLPHFDDGIRIQFITLRLADSLPQTLLNQLKLEVALRDVDSISRETLILVEKYLDKGYGECLLKRREVAEIVRDSLLHIAEDKCKLYSWVIMPNHLHCLIKPLENNALHKIMHSLKSFSAHEVNKVLNRTGKFWMREYFDRYIRDEEHFQKAVRYIEKNPVKAGLCENASDWEFSSAWEGNAVVQTAKGVD
jgi:REP element-mobilizing transposase RayT